MVVRLQTPLRVYAGDDFAVAFRFKMADGSPADLSQYDAWSSQWRHKHQSDDAVDFTVEVDGGEITLSLTAEQTQSMCDGVFDIQSVTDGVVRTFVAGNVVVTGDVTR